MDEATACIPIPVNQKAFNPAVKLPYGLKTEHIKKAMGTFTGFLEVVNLALYAKKIDRLESILARKF